MFWKKKNRAVSDERLDRVGAELLSALGSDDAVGELPDAAASLAALRTRIAAERRVREAAPGFWEAIFAAPRLAVPALALVTLAAVGAFWWSGSESPEKIDVAREVQPPPVLVVTAPVSACALSNKPECILTTGDVLATMMTTAPKEPRR
jgi:hypothetical protein